LLSTARRIYKKKIPRNSYVYCGERDQLSAVVTPDRFMGRHLFGALEPLRRKFEGPGQDEGDGKSENKQQHHQPNRPVGDFEERENLGGNLDQYPADDGIGDRNAINVTSLQLA